MTLAGCQDCEYQETEETLSGEDRSITLNSEEGGPVVTLSVPGSLTEGTGGTINVQFARERNSLGSTDSPLKSAVVDITLTVEDQVVTQLADPIEICLTDANQFENVSPTLCLGFFDVQQQEWLCEDLSLSLNAQGQWCGETGHLTSFALLLGGDTGSSGEYFPQSTIAWISLGFIAGAIIIVVLGVGAVEIRYRNKYRVERRMYRTLDDRMRSLS